MVSVTLRISLTHNGESFKEWSHPKDSDIKSYLYELLIDDDITPDQAKLVYTLYQLARNENTTSIVHTATDMVVEWKRTGE